MLVLAACGGEPSPGNSAAASPSSTAPSPSASASPTPTAVPTPSAVPTGAPGLAELTVSADGLGPLLLGSAVAGEGLEMVELVEDCSRPFWQTVDAYTVPDGGYGGAGGPAFTVRSEAPDAPLQRIDVLGQEIATEEGIRVGAPRSDVEAAYPDAERVDDAGLTTLFVVPGETGQLLIEVAGSDLAYWQEDADTVVYLRVIGADREPTGIAATDDVVGFCADPE